MSLSAPYQAPTTVLLLPSPNLANAQKPDDKLDYDETMDGTPYAYVRKGSIHELTYSFSSIGRGKLLEVQEFFIAFAGEKALLVDHNGDRWQATISDDAVIVTHDGKGEPAGGPLEEAGSFNLTFLAKEA